MEIDKSRILRNVDLLLKIQSRFQCNRIFRKKIEPDVFFFLKCTSHGGMYRAH